MRVLGLLLAFYCIIMLTKGNVTMSEPPSQAPFVANNP